MIHTTGDVEYGKIARKSEGAVEAGIRALAAGRADLYRCGNGADGDE